MAKTRKEEEDLPDKAVISKYLRGEPTVNPKKIKDKKVKGDIQRTEAKIKEAAIRAADAEFLLKDAGGYLEAEGLEKTYRVKQTQIKRGVDSVTALKSFQLDLDHFGPYNLDYTRNGRFMLIGGRKGHCATFDWQSGKLGAEIHLRETVRDVKWLHNEMMFAVAQKRHVYIYDHTGMEIHSLKNQIEINRLDFLPFHFLLTSVGNAGVLKYLDTSTGNLVAEHKTKLGRCDVMAQNPWNAIMHLGHANGTVTMWSPNMSSPLVKMLCHRGPITALAVDPSGTYMTTAGYDSQVMVWDIRKLQPVHSYYSHSPASSLSISQKGMLAVGYGPNVNVWKDAFQTKQTAPYMTHLQPASMVRTVRFCPYEDVLGVGHATGITSLLIPGSGEPNYDALEANPYQTKKQRQEAEVKSLLDKIQPEMITLDPSIIANVDNMAGKKDSGEVQQNVEEKVDKIFKHKARGRSSAVSKVLNRQKNVVDAKKELIRERLERERKEQLMTPAEKEDSKLPYALSRFAKPKTK